MSAFALIKRTPSVKMLNVYRLARFQAYMGIPLPEGTQWQLILEVYQVAKVILRFASLIEPIVNLTMGSA